MTSSARIVRLLTAVPPVERIEMVQGFVPEEPADPMWRVQVSGFCTDFETETAASNFRNAILALVGL